MPPQYDTIRYWVFNVQDEEVNQDNNGEADRMNLEVDSKDEVMHI